jgi:hypothetical protein
MLSNELFTVLEKTDNLVVSALNKLLVTDKVNSTI